MKSIFRDFCLFVCLLFAAAASAQTPTNTAAATVSPPTEDHQFWNETQLIKHISGQQDLILIGALRIGREFTRPVDERLGVGFAFKINPHLTVTPTYLHVEYQPYPGRVVHEERLVMNVTGKFKLGKYTFTDRNLIERRVRHSVADFTVYRNRLRIDHPAQLGKFAFEAFIADEAWYSTQSGKTGEYGWYRNRISVGVAKQLSEHFSGEFFLLYQHDGLSRPGNIPVIGTLFRYTL